MALAMPIFVNFNPRSREGSDTFDVPFDERYVISIRAPARGATRTATTWTRTAKFQSALPRGERQNGLAQIMTVQPFQSALPRGERRNNAAKCSLTGDFNPRSREGSDINFRQKILFVLSKNCLIHLFFITNFLN